MFYGLSHVEVPVADLGRSESLYGKVFGFLEQKRGEGFVDLDGGATTVRLVQTGKTTAPARLRIQVRDVPAALRAAVAGGASIMYEAMRTPELEEMAVAKDPDGNIVILWRPLTEDEYDFTPPLPTDLRWDSDAAILLQQLLGHVPALFRGLARRRVTRVAEELSVESHSRFVQREHVIRAFILASARVTRDRTRAPLRSHGIDPDAYRADYEA